jgi:hypothetical protein
MDKKLTVRAVLFLFAITLLFFSCDGVSNSENEFNVTDGYAGVELTIQGSMPLSASPGRAAGDPVVLMITDEVGNEDGQLTLSDARINVYQIELEQDLDDVNTEEEIDQESEIEYTGPFVVDLLSGLITPELPYIELLPGNYDEIKIKIARIEGDETDTDGNPLVDISDPLYDNSIVLSGTYSGDISAESVIDMNVSIKFALDEEFVLSSANGLSIDEAVINEIIVAFRLNRWFHFHNSETNSSSIEFNSVVKESDGEGGFRISLDDSSTSDNGIIWEVIKENIKESADFGEDEDESGELESDEDNESDDDDDY